MRGYFWTYWFDFDSLDKPEEYGGWHAASSDWSGEFWFSGQEATPERTAFVRFRKLLSAHGLDEILFEQITAQLRAKSVQIKTGTIIDATIITSASKGFDEVRWVKHKGKPARHGYKAHVAADADTSLIEELAITPAKYE